MPTLAELERALRAADAAGNTADASKLARAYQAAREHLSRQEKESEPAPRSDRLEQFRLELADWEKIKSSRDPQDFFAYLGKYPSGYMSEQAQFRLDQLAGPGVEALPGPNHPKPLPSGTRRYEVGDQFDFDLVEKLTGITRRFTSTITFANDERAEYNNGFEVVDQMGGIIHNPGGTKTPARLVEPASLAIGKRWQTAFHNRKESGFEEDVTWDYRVEAFESVAVPAGTIRAFRVEGRGLSIWRSSVGVGRLRETRWIDPTVMRTVRRITEHWTNRSIDTYEELLLVRVSLAPRIPRTAH